MFEQIFLGGEDKTSEIKEFGAVIGLNRLAPDRFSSYFAIQLYCQMLLTGNSPNRIMAEVEALENTGKQSATKPPARFDRLPLKGLWHKHHMVPGLSSMATNLLNGLKKNGLSKLTEKVREAKASGEERFLEEQDIAEIAKEAVEDNYRRRYGAGEMTGEWIVYAAHEGRNYYLCLGTHNSGDDELRKQIDSICVPEFPFLKDILAPLD